MKEKILGRIKVMNPILVVDDNSPDGTGALAEKPELFTNILILVALPETIVVLGFVIGFLILGNI